MSTSPSPRRARRSGSPRRGTVLLRDRKSTRLNSSHDQISYAVFCLKKKKESDYDFHGHDHTTLDQHAVHSPHTHSKYVPAIIVPVHPTTCTIATRTSHTASTTVNHH